MHWQGCLILAAAATTGAVAVGQEHVAVRARVFDIAYEVERLLKKRRWEKREEPFRGFNSPPGRF